MLLQNNHSRLPPLSEFKIRWIPLFVYSILHLGAFAALFNFSATALAVSVALFFSTLWFGITVGYHRLIAHSAFETNAYSKIFHMLMASFSLQLGPITWARLHFIHHAKADTPEDPHSQSLGFFWGYFGWIFLSHPVVGRSSLKKKLHLKHLKRDRVVRFFEKYTFAIFVIHLAGLYLLGGLSMLLWAGCLRVVLSSHLTWFLNRYGHGYGKRSFATKDQSTNSFLIALLTFGEGWHNNHHNFPASARFGLRWYQIDFGYWWIALLEKTGLAWNLKTPAVYAPEPTGPIHLKEMVVRNLEETRAALAQDEEDLELALLHTALTGETPDEADYSIPGFQVSTNVGEG